jgi:hypothetical protein
MTVPSCPTCGSTGIPIVCGLPGVYFALVYRGCRSVHPMPR